jgi:isoleucyl-tRNA synthetase
MHKSKGNAIPFEDAAEKMSADVVRWLFCRHNPANNLNFGYGPAEELRNKFVLKLWNVYAFFCNYARIDGFDPHPPQVPLAQRPDIDRWILSDLQLLTQTARREFERFSVQTFCLQAEQFVDDRLSNWYVRRNRRRFWKSEKGTDKLAAYQTLYTVLTTFTNLIAPVAPFLAEAMFQNLVPNTSASDGHSVHLADFPQVDATLIDADLSADMDALLRLVSLGSAARNSVKIKVRQPLAELKVQPADERDRRAVERFADQIAEELNIKKITLHDAKTGSLLSYQVKPNMKTLGPKFGPRLKEVQTAIATADAAAVAKAVQAAEPFDLTTPGGPVTLEAGDVVLQQQGPEGWAAIADKGTMLAIDTRLTTELKQEGMAREVVRHVQNLRKEGDLEMEDRISLFLATESAELQAAIQTHKDYIMAETLCVQWSTQSLGAEATCGKVKVDSAPLHVELRKL